MTSEHTQPGRSVVWREGVPPADPQDAAAARQRLNDGNAAFAALGHTGGQFEVLVGPGNLGLSRGSVEDLRQTPFAAVLGCSDARVPVELVFGLAANNLFVVRVAGNVPGSDCVGSLHYAAQNLQTIQLLVVLGHSQCGAMTAAVDAVLHPGTYLALVHDPALRGVVDSLLAGVHMAAAMLAEVHGRQVTTRPGYREALISVSAMANTAISATVLAADMDRRVAMGLYDLATRTVGTVRDGVWQPGLVFAPDDDVTLADLLRDAAGLAFN